MTVEGVDHPVDIVRSARRKKTVQARLRDGRIEMRVPAGMSDREIQHHLAALVPRLERQHRAAPVDLIERAERLARRFDLPRPHTIRWVSNQSSRWGSCTFDAGAIRISDRLAEVPDFVLDYVVLHELTHLVESDHGPGFRALMARYRQADKAEGYLMALSRHGLV
ncbi:MAG: M48 family metallopeptidase [Acidimicrobiia bacterium]|nr:M48 family metallopeptidase [Acidimicrobiia bacterium]MDH5235989.1 M48 family metallopeptidase [Acidimicrobiia bacterium]